MKWLCWVLVLSFLILPAADMLAHPGSGIVVDRQGNIYFIDTGSGIWKIDRQGKLTRLSAPAYHWMAFDPDRRLAAVSLPHYSRDDATVERDRNDPRIIVSSDFPITVGPDGALYYAWNSSGEGFGVFRFTASGTTTTVKSLPLSTDGRPLRWVNGLVATQDGSLYYTEDRAVRRLTAKGELTTVAANITLSGCDCVPGLEPASSPYLRGLDVDTSGNVFVAATGCCALLKIAPDGKVTTILRTSPPWSPTAVAVAGSDLYVLEYFHTEGDNRREWMPRVRKVSADGTVVTVASIDRR